MTQNHIPEDLNLWQHCCTNHKLWKPLLHMIPHIGKQGCTCDAHTHTLKIILHTIYLVVCYCCTRWM